MQQEEHMEQDREDGAPGMARRGAAAPVAYVCADCAKRYALVPGDHERGASPRCTCGGELEREVLAPGLYELEGARPAQPKAQPAAAPKRGEDTTPREADLGYNESHGYGPSHGGPTGPGDAPAAPSEGTPKSAPRAEEDEEEAVRGDI